MKTKEILGYPYETKDVTLDKASMGLIDIVNQRQLRGTQVNSILRELKQGKHFDSMFVVNVNNNTKRIRVIDGGHRTEALKKYFEANPDKKVKVSMAAYKDLTDAQEREIYTKWNLGVKQSIEDFINSYKKELPEFESLLERLPVSIYGSKNKMKLRHMVDAYLSSKQQPFMGGPRYTRAQWLDELKKLNHEDILSIKNTFGIISEIFNPRDVVDFTRLPAFRISIFRALFHLVHFNKTVLGRNYVVKRMRTVLAHSSELEQFKMHHRQASIEAYLRFKQLLNTGVDHQFK